MDLEAEFAESAQDTAEWAVFCLPLASEGWETILSPIHGPQPETESQRASRLFNDWLREGIA